jgi:hypothetical protein
MQNLVDHARARARSDVVEYWGEKRCENDATAGRFYDIAANGFLQAIVLTFHEDLRLHAANGLERGVLIEDGHCIHESKRTS